MRIDVLTLFPEAFSGPLQASILGRALSNGMAEVELHDIRAYARDKHQVVDDYAYGGGPGMVMKPEPLAEAIETVRGLGSQAQPARTRGRVVLLTPQGRVLNQELVDELAGEERLILVCGHYEGVDERIREHLIDDEVSIGDYVLSGGEVGALVLNRHDCAASAGDAGFGRFAARGVAFGWPVGVSPVHASGGVSRMASTRYTAFR